MQIKSELKRLYVIFLLVLICHIQGCFIYAVATSDEIWIPPTDFGILNTDIHHTEGSMEHRGFAYTYVKVLYHSTLVYSMVDISARS